MKENLILEKSYKFAVRIIKLYQYLKTEKQEITLAKQILRSGTSVGANIEESQGGYSRKEFTNKLSISYKEARETKFWLSLLHDTGYINTKMFASLQKDCDEILKIITSILNTLKKDSKS